ncbi:hypothetical protein ACQ4M3_09355 [Leptolyngbya sp. AN03gr2]
MTDQNQNPFADLPIEMRKAPAFQPGDISALPDLSGLEGSSRDVGR